MTESVSALVGKFALRRNAATFDFAEGVRLARLGAVTLEQVSRGEVRAQVQDGDTYDVRVFAQDGQLRGECPCSPDALMTCKHQVAVTHAIWVRNHLGIGPR